MRGPRSSVAARLYRRYAGVPYPNADDKALSMAASSARTSGTPTRVCTFWGSKASRRCMHFCNRSIRPRFCPTVRTGGLGLGGGTERRAMRAPESACDKGDYHIFRGGKEPPGIGRLGSRLRRLSKEVRSRQRCAAGSPRPRQMRKSLREHLSCARGLRAVRSALEAVASRTQGSGSSDQSGQRGPLETAVNPRVMATDEGIRGGELVQMDSFVDPHSLRPVREI